MEMSLVQQVLERNLVDLKGVIIRFATTEALIAIQDSVTSRFLFESNFKCI
jgi:hypothetical protein